MAGKGSAGNVCVSLLQRIKDSAVVMICACLPFLPPLGKQEARARGVQIVDGRNQPGHMAGRKDEAVKLAVRLLPFMDILSLLSLAVRLFGAGKNFACHVGNSVTQGQCFEG